MSAADEAYEAAERLIEKAKADGREILDFNDEPFQSLTLIPPEIEELVSVRFIGLNRTSVSDLSPLSGMSGLQELWLIQTKVEDLMPLSALSKLRVLRLNDTAVLDLKPVSGLAGLVSLTLNHTAVSDLAPVSRLGALRNLWLTQTTVTDLTPLSELRELNALGLGQTAVIDLAPLSELSQLETLSVEQTGIVDLTPLSGLRRLKELYLDGCPVLDLRPLPRNEAFLNGANALRSGLRFEGCGAAKKDERIAEISEIKDYAERARVLFDYLKDWVPPGEGLVPSGSVAPVRAVLRDGRVASLSEARARAEAARDLAEKGWASLRLFRQTFGKSFNCDNYAVLKAWMEAFDESMGEVYEPERAVLIGSIGSGISVLSTDKAFTENLPAGAAVLLQQFGVQIEVFLNRFETWVEYKEAAAGWEVSGQAVAEDRAPLRDIGAGLTESEQVDRAVERDFDLMLRAAEAVPQDDMAAKGVIASTREVMRPVAEAAIAAVKEGGGVRQLLDEVEGVHDSEKAKWLWRGGGWAFVMMRRRSPQIRRLARRYPGRLGWLARVMDYLGGDPE